MKWKDLLLLMEGCIFTVQQITNIDIYFIVDLTVNVSTVAATSSGNILYSDISIFECHFHSCSMYMDVKLTVILRDMNIVC